MLNETASSRDNLPFSREPLVHETPEDRLADAIREMVADVLEIEQEQFADEEADEDDIPPVMRALGGRMVARFAGRLRLDSEAAYDRLDRLCTPVDLLPLFRIEGGQHVVLILRGRVNPQPRPWWPNAVLFVLTLFSVLMVGASLALPGAQSMEALMANLWRGAPYAISILLILGAHELGHYFAARRHKLAVTLPYFIPLPFISPFGTLGAFIQLRQPMRNRKVLLDVGAAGPLAGLVFAVPILFIGLASARVGPVGSFGVYEGDSLLYAFAKIVTFGRFLPSNGIDVFVDSSQLAWAGWTGLLVSALNLIPVGQLDGGHIMYSLLGERARWLYYPLLGIMLLLVLMTEVWLLWLVLLLIFGRFYATPLDMITPLDTRRRAVGVLAMVIFVLIFVPTPLTPYGSPVPEEPLPRNSVMSPSAWADLPIRLSGR